MEPKIRQHKLETVDISTIKFDESNPNQLNKEQMTGLEKSMNRFGYLTPIIIDQNGKIADGEHRVLVYKQLGITKIPAYRIELKNDVERRILRQVMNKLRGEHELAKDTQEIIKIIEAGQLNDLSMLLAQKAESFQYMMDQYNKNRDEFQDAISKNIETNNKCPQCGYEW